MLALFYVSADPSGFVADARPFLEILVQETRESATLTGEVDGFPALSGGLDGFCRETHSSPRRGEAEQPRALALGSDADCRSPERAKQKINGRNNLRRPYRAYHISYTCPQGFTLGSASPSLRD